ncbi:MAG: hypothetical protein MHPSP_003757, partial [Paramarteilia canceri]
KKLQTAGLFLSKSAFNCMNPVSFNTQFAPPTLPSFATNASPSLPMMPLPKNPLQGLPDMPGQLGQMPMVVPGMPMMGNIPLNMPPPGFGMPPQ